MLALLWPLDLPAAEAENGPEPYGFPQRASESIYFSQLTSMFHHFSSFFR